MIFLWILLALILLVAILLFCKVHIVFSYREEAKVVLRYLFITLEGEKIFKILSGSDQKKDSQSPPKKDLQEKKEEKGDLLGFLSFLGHITWVIKETVLEYLANSHIFLKELKVSVASDDAAKTAVLYGTVMQAANGLTALLQEFTDFTWQDENLSIQPDFSGSKSTFRIHLVLSTRLYSLLLLYFRANLRFFEGKETLK